jgi:hypothetical protein
MMQAGHVKQLYEWFSILSSHITKVVTNAQLPECFTADTAMRHFQSALQQVPKSVRSQMQSAAQNCRQRGLLIKMCVPDLPASPSACWDINDPVYLM